MIITLKGADFSQSNIGTLSTYSIRFDSNGVTNVNTSVDRETNTGYTATITFKENYELDGSITVTMGGTDITSTALSGLNINIAKVTGNVVITVPVKSSNESSTVVIINPAMTINKVWRYGPIPKLGTTATSNYGHSEPILINPGEYITMSTTGVGFAPMTIVSEDGQTGYQNIHIGVSDDDKEGAGDPTIRRNYAYSPTESTYISLSAKVSEAPVFKKGTGTTRIPTFTTLADYIDPTTEAMTASTAYKHTSPIELKAGEILTTRQYGAGIAAIATIPTSDSTEYTCVVPRNHAGYGTEVTAYQWETSYQATEDCYAICSYRAANGEPKIIIITP